jgi:hypothetical protein
MEGKNSSSMVLLQDKFRAITCLVVITVFLSSFQAVSAFELQVNLYDAKSDSGKVNISVVSEATGKEKSRTIDVGKITAKSGESTVEGTSFMFSEKDLPPNGAFMACAYSISLDLKSCEQADRHYDAQSAIMWVQVPQ